MLFWLFAIEILCVQPDEWQSVITSIKDLKNKTQFSTYYELFNVSEGASFSKIKKNYMSMIRKSNPIPSSFLPKHEQVDILTQGFNILRKKRDAYDFVLYNSKWLYDDRKNYENTKIIKLVSILALLICIDIGLYLIRYIRYCNSYTVVQQKNKNKKNKKSGYNSIVYGNKSQLCLYRFLCFVKRILLK